MSAIAVLGSANMDLVVRQPRLPRPGETIFGSAFATIPGGKGLNQAVAAARAGAQVAFLGAVGSDLFGDTLRRQLEADGIDVSSLVRVAAATGTAHIAVLDDGENSIVVVPGANAAVVEVDDLTRRAIASSGYLMAQFERPVELIAEAFEIARALRVITVLTPAPVLQVDDQLLGMTDVLIPNAREARELAGLDDESAAALALSRRCGLVVMTRGDRGALVARGGEVVAEVPARPATAVDTTAAGDTFAGVLVARMAAGDALDAALAAATIAASISVTRAGASSSMPRWAEVEAIRAAGAPSPG